MMLPVLDQGPLPEVPMDFHKQDQGCRVEGFKVVGFWEQGHEIEQLPLKPRRNPTTFRSLKQEPFLGSIGYIRDVYGFPNLRPVLGGHVST